MSELMRPVFDADLIEKYGGEGPRYTSGATSNTLQVCTGCRTGPGNRPAYGRSGRHTRAQENRFQSSVHRRPGSRSRGAEGGQPRSRHGLVASILGAARAVGFESISVDLIYGLPLQKTTGFSRTVESIIHMNPDRISLFNYAHLPHLFTAQRQIQDEQMPSPATKLAIFRNTLARLLDAGYEFIGMDHFARPNDSLVKAKPDGSMVRNFQGYSTHGGLDLVSFGPSAISQVGDSFAQNHRKLEDWTVSLIEDRLPTARGLTRLTDDHIRGDIIERIVCNGELDFTAVGRAHGLDSKRCFAAEIQRLQPLADDHLIELDEAGFKVTENGLLFLRAIAKTFDAYLAPAGQSQGRFSRII